MITTGGLIAAAKAGRSGWWTRWPTATWWPAAVAFATEQGGKGPRPSARASSTRHPCPPACSKARASVGSASRGPWRAIGIDAVEASTLPVQRGLGAGTRAVHAELCQPLCAGAAVHIFAERQAANLPGIGADTKPRNVKTVGILGAGTMGRGIGLAFLNAGFPVTIVETTQSALDRGVARIRDTLEATPSAGASGRRRRASGSACCRRHLI